MPNTNCALFSGDSFSKEQEKELENECFQEPNQEEEELPKRRIRIPDIKFTNNPEHKDYPQTQSESTPFMRSAITLWTLLTPNLDGSVNKENVVGLWSRLCRLLLPGIKWQQADVVGEREWYRDTLNDDAMTFPNFLSSWNEFIESYAGQSVPDVIKSQISEILAHKLTLYENMKGEKFIPRLDVYVANTSVSVISEESHLDRYLLSKGDINYDGSVGVVPLDPPKSESACVKTIEMECDPEQLGPQVSNSVLRHCKDRAIFGLGLSSERPNMEDQVSDDFSMKLENAGTLKAVFHELRKEKGLAISGDIEDKEDQQFQLWPRECNESPSRSNYKQVVYPEVPRVWFYSQNFSYGCCTAKQLALCIGARYIEPTSLINEHLSFPPGWGVAEVSKLYQRRAFMRAYEGCLNEAFRFYDKLDNEEDSSIRDLRAYHEQIKSSDETTEEILDKMEEILSSLREKQDEGDPDRILIAEAIMIAVQEEKRFLVGEQSSATKKGGKSSKKKPKKRTDFQNPRLTETQLLEAVSSKLKKKVNALVDEVIGEEYRKKEKLLLRRLGRIVSTIANLQCASFNLPKDPRSVLGQLSDNALISGEPVSDEIVQRLVRDAMVEAIEAGCGYVLDRYPFTEYQYNELENSVEELLSQRASSGSALVSEWENNKADRSRLGVNQLEYIIQTNSADVSVVVNESQYQRELGEGVSGATGERYEAAGIREPITQNALGKFKEDDVEREKGLRAHHQQQIQDIIQETLCGRTEKQKDEQGQVEHTEGGERKGVQIGEHANQYMTFDFRRPSSGISYGRSRDRSRSGSMGRQQELPPLPDIMEAKTPHTYAITCTDDVMPTEVLHDEHVCPLTLPVDIAMHSGFLSPRFSQTELDISQLTDPDVTEPVYDMGHDIFEREHVSQQSRWFGVENVFEEVDTYVESTNGFREAVFEMITESGIRGVKLAANALAAPEEDEEGGLQTRISRMTSRFMEEAALIMDISDYVEAKTAIEKEAQEEEEKVDGLQSGPGQDESTENAPQGQDGNEGEGIEDQADADTQEVEEPERADEGADNEEEVLAENEESNPVFDPVAGSDGSRILLRFANCWRKLLGGVRSKSHVKLLKDIPQLGWRNFRSPGCFRTGPSALRSHPSLVKQAGASCISLHGTSLIPENEAADADEEEARRKPPELNPFFSDYLLSIELFDGFLPRRVSYEALAKHSRTGKFPSSAGCIFQSEVDSGTSQLVQSRSHIPINSSLPKCMQMTVLLARFTTQVGPPVGRMTNDSICPQAVSIPDEFAIDEDQVEQPQDLGQVDFVCGLKSEDGSTVGNWPVDETTTQRIRHLLYGSVLPRQYDLQYESATLDPSIAYGLRVESTENIMTNLKASWQQWTSLFHNSLWVVSILRQQRCLCDWIIHSRTLQDLNFYGKAKELDSKEDVPELTDDDTAKQIKIRCDAVVAAYEEQVNELYQQEEQTEQQLEASGEEEAEQLDSWTLDWQHTRAVQLPIDNYTEKFKDMGNSLIAQDEEEDEGSSSTKLLTVRLVGLGGGGIKGDTFYTNNKLVSTMMESPEDISLGFSGEEELGEQLGDIDEDEKSKWMDMLGFSWVGSEDPEESSEWRGMVRCLQGADAVGDKAAEKINDSSIVRLEKRWLCSMKQLAQYLKARASQREFSAYRLVCPVSLFKEGRLRWGCSQFCATHGGKLYFFGSAEKLHEFLRFPLQYTLRTPALPKSFFPVLASPSDLDGFEQVTTKIAEVMSLIKVDAKTCRELSSESSDKLRSYIESQLHGGSPLTSSAFSALVLRLFKRCSLSSSDDGSDALILDDEKLNGALEGIEERTQSLIDKETSRQMKEISQVRSGKAPSKPTKEDTKHADEGNNWLNQFKEKIEPVCEQLNTEETQPYSYPKDDEGNVNPPPPTPDRLELLNGCLGTNFPHHPALWRALIELNVVPDIVVLFDPTRDWDAYMKELLSDGTEEEEAEQEEDTKREPFTFAGGEELVSLDIAPQSDSLLELYNPSVGTDASTPMSALLSRTVYLLRRNNVQVRVVPTKGMDQVTILKLAYQAINPFADRVKPLSLCQHSDESGGFEHSSSSLKYYCPVSLVESKILNPSYCGELDDAQTLIKFEAQRYRIEYLGKESRASCSSVTQVTNFENELSKVFTFSSASSLSLFCLQPRKYLRNLALMGGKLSPTVVLPILWFAPQTTGTTSTLYRLTKQILNGRDNIPTAEEYSPVRQFTQFNVRVLDLESEMTSLPKDIEEFFSRIHQEVIVKHLAVVKILKSLLRRRYRVLQKDATLFTDLNVAAGEEEEEGPKDEYVVFLRNLIERSAKEYIPSAHIVSEYASQEVSETLCYHCNRSDLLCKIMFDRNDAGLTCKEVVSLRKYIMKAYTPRPRLEYGNEIAVTNERGMYSKWENEANCFNQVFVIANQLDKECGSNEVLFKKVAWETQQLSDLFGDDLTSAILRGDMDTSLELARQHAIIEDNVEDITPWLPKIPEAVAHSDEMHHGAQLIAKARMEVDKTINQIEHVQEEAKPLLEEPEDSQNPDDEFENIEGFSEGKPVEIVAKSLERLIKERVGVTYRNDGREEPYELCFIDNCRLVDEAVIRKCQERDCAPFMTFHTTVKPHPKPEDILEEANISSCLPKKSPSFFGQTPRELQHSVKEGFGTSLHVAFQRTLCEFYWKVPPVEKLKGQLVQLYSTLREKKLKQYALELRQKWLVKQIKKEAKGRFRSPKENWRKQALAKLNESDEFNLPEEYQPTPNTDLIEKRNEAVKTLLQQSHENVVQEIITVSNVEAATSLLGVNTVSVPFSSHETLHVDLKYSLTKSTSADNGALRILSRLIGCPSKSIKVGKEEADSSPVFSYMASPKWPLESVPRCLTTLHGVVVPPSHASYLITSGVATVSKLGNLCPVSLATCRQFHDTLSTWAGDSWSNLIVATSEERAQGPNGFMQSRRFPVVVGRTIFFCSSRLNAISFARNPKYFLSCLQELDPCNLPVRRPAIAVVSPSEECAQPLLQSLEHATGGVIVTPEKVVNWFLAIQNQTTNLLPGMRDLVSSESLYHGISRRAMHEMVVHFLKYNGECLLKGWILSNTISSEDEVHFFEQHGIEFSRTVIHDPRNRICCRDAKQVYDENIAFTEQFIGIRPSEFVTGEEPEEESKRPRASKHYGRSSSSWLSSVVKDCLSVGPLVETGAEAEGDEGDQAAANEDEGEDDEESQRKSLEGIYYNGTDGNEEGLCDHEALYATSGFYAPLDESTGNVKQVIATEDSEEAPEDQSVEVTILASSIKVMTGSSDSPSSASWILSKFQRIPKKKNQKTILGPRSAITSGILAVSEMARFVSDESLSTWNREKLGIQASAFQRCGCCSYLQCSSLSNLLEVNESVKEDQMTNYVYDGSMERGQPAPIGRQTDHLGTFVGDLSPSVGPFCAVNWDRRKHYVNVLLSSKPLLFACEFEKRVYLLESVDELRDFIRDPCRIIDGTHSMHDSPSISRMDPSSVVTSSFKSGLCPVSLADYKDNSVPAYGFPGLCIEYKANAYFCHSPQAFAEFFHCPEKFLGRAPSSILYPPRPKPVPAGSTTSSRLPYPNRIIGQRSLHESGTTSLSIMNDAAAPIRGYLEQSYGGVLRVVLANAAKTYHQLKHPTLSKSKTLYILIALDFRANNTFLEKAEKERAQRKLAEFQKECFSIASSKSSGAQVRIVEALRTMREEHKHEEISAASVWSRYSSSIS